MEIQYRYALDEHDQPIDVLGLERAAVDPGRVFKCVACGRELIAKLGDIKAKHFAHKTLTSSCAYETYLHQLAKKTFYSEYLKCLENQEPFHLVRTENVTCDHFENKYGYTCARTEDKYYDLTKLFDRVALEKHHDGFVADVLLQSSKNGEVIFVEFAVSHKCEEDKLKSGIRIIEYILKDEIHLELVKAHKIHDNDERLLLHNFRTRSEKKSLCGGNCSAKLNAFVVYASKKSILVELDPQREVDSQLRGKISHFEMLGKSSGKKDEQVLLYRQKVREAHFRTVSIKNCFLCRYHGGDGVENAVFCKVDRKSVGSNQAVECEKYRPLRTMVECLELDKKNEEYVQKKKIGDMIRTIIPGPYIK
jgi:hypothetical protein